MDQINANPALQTADGANASDLLDQNNGFYGFLVNAASPGWPAAQIQTVFTGSTNLDAMPAGTNTLDDNVRDLQPRAHVYLSSGAASLPLQFTLDTTRFADGFHDLTAVAYEGTSVRTQTRVALDGAIPQHRPLRRLCRASGRRQRRSPLCHRRQRHQYRPHRVVQHRRVDRGGNQPAAAQLIAPAATLGVGLHPFSAVVTDANGHEYQTPTVWEQVPALQLSVIGPPPALSWPAIVGRQYSVLAATNLGGAFQTVGTVVASNGLAQWTISAPPTGEVFYRVSVSP